MIQPNIHKIDIAKKTNKGNILLPYVIRLFFISSSKLIKFLNRLPSSGFTSGCGEILLSWFSSSSSESPPKRELIMDIKAFIWGVSLSSHFIPPSDKPRSFNVDVPL